MKKRNLAFLLILLVLAILSSVFSLLPEQFGQLFSFPISKGGDRPYQWPTAVSERMIQESRNLDVQWQISGVNSSVSVDGPFMTAKNGNVAFLGSVNRQDAYHLIVLNTSDGTQVAEIDSEGYSTEFTMDDSAIYLGSPGIIKKIDYLSGQQIWRQDIGSYNVPRFFRLVNGELQSSWNRNAFFILSASNGEISKKMIDMVTPIFLLEDDVLFYQGSPGILYAKKLDGNIIWQTKLDNHSINQAPVFAAGNIYVRTGIGIGKIFSVDRDSGQLIWDTDENVLGSFAVSESRLYYLSLDGYLIGLNLETGVRETTAKFSPNELYNPNASYQVAYDGLTRNILLLLGDSAQMFALKEVK